MLDGELLESQYEWPEEEGPMHLKKENIYKKNEVTYINGTFFFLSFIYLCIIFKKKAPI